MSTNSISTSSSSSYYLSCHSKTSNVVLATIKPRPIIDRTQRFTKLTVKYRSISMGKPKPGDLVRAKASASPNNSSSPWQVWVLGILVTVILPFLGYKGGLLSNLKSKIDKAVEVVGNVAKVVEEVGEEAEKILEEVEEKLPEDSKLKETLASFDDLAKKAVSEARMAEDVVHKVKDVEEEIEETIGKPGKGQPQK